MSESQIDTIRVVELLLQDAIPTLGERARVEVLQLAANYEARAGEWIDDGRSLADAQRGFDSAIVDGLQQTAHDWFWDTTWPACPVHPRHPLWYDESRQAWRCRQEPAKVIPLGRLAEFNPPDA